MLGGLSFRSLIQGGAWFILIVGGVYAGSDGRLDNRLSFDSIGRSAKIKDRPLIEKQKQEKTETELSTSRITRKMILIERERAAHVRRRMQARERKQKTKRAVASGE